MSLNDNILAAYNCDVNGSFIDSVGTYSNGTISWSTYTASGKINWAYDFDGTNDYIVLADANWANWLSEFTISGWFYADTLSWVQYWLENTSSSSPNVQFFFLSDGTTFKFWANDGTIRTVETTIATWQWYHIIGKKTTSWLVLKIDNWTPITESSCTWNIVSLNQNTVLGRRNYDATRYFNGRIDVLNIWDKATSDAEDTELYYSWAGLQYPFTKNLTNNLVSYYKADTNGSFPDSVGSNNGTINWATYTASGIINWAYNFDGTNDYIWWVVPLAWVSNFTLNTWIKPDNVSSNRVIYSARKSWTWVEVWTLRINASWQIEFSDQISWAFNSTGTLSAWTRYMITLTRSWTSWNIYINWSSDGSTTNTAGTTTASDAPDWPAIWRYSTAWQYFDWIIDEFWAWNRVLSTSEIAELYLQWSGNQYAFEPAQIIAC